MAAGTASTPRGADFALVRYNSDGSLDPSFGGQGTVTTDFFGADNGIESILVMADGRILAGGYAVNSRTVSVFALALYDSSGGLDRSFGNSGKATFEFLGQGDYARTVALQPDGKIVVGGTVTSNHTGVSGLVRLNDDGSLDSSFGAGGRVTTDFISLFETLGLQPDGKILVAGGGGYVDRVKGPLAGFALTRFNADGSVDTGFGSDGKVVTALSGRGDWVVSVRIQPNGRILAAGPSWIPDTLNFNFVVAGYNPDGRPDASLGVGGTAIDSFFTKQSYIYSVVFQSDGKAVAIGHTGKYGHGHSSFAVARYSVGTD